MQIRLLGPLELSGPAGPVPVAGAKERAVLAILALEAGRAVSDDQLIDSLWGPQPPRTAVRTLRSYVSRLRKALAAAEGDGVVIETSPAGYRLSAGPDVLDLSRVEDLLTRARAAVGRGDPAWAAVALAEAERAWRGRPLGDLADEPWAITHANRLSELELVVLEERIEAELACGRHAVLVAELDSLCAKHPLRERLWAQRMTALYRSGRQADALRAYRQLRGVLTEELGIEPNPELQALERAVLAQDPTLDLRPPAEGFSAPPAPAPELPGGVVTLMLTAIEGSAALWEQDPRAMASALARHDRLVAEAVGRRGGRIVRSKGEGDSTLSVFTRAGDGAAAAAALQCGLLAERWPDALALGVRIALHTCEPEQRDGDYCGAALARASALRDLAASGTILCSRAAADLVVDSLPEDCALVDLGQQQLKGLSRAEHVFALVHPQLPVIAWPRPSPGAASERVPMPSELLDAQDAPFVGRRTEREQLIAMMGTVGSGRGRAVLLAGEPGIGKTRLAAELAAEAFATGWTILYGSSDEDLGVAYQPFVEALRHLVRTCPLDLLHSHVAVHGGELSRILPDMGRRVPGLPEPMIADPDGQRLHLFDAVVGLLGAASASAPVILILDDVHWATKPTLMLLRHVVAAVGRLPVLLMATYRDTEVTRSHPLGEMLADLRRVSRVDRLPLAGLDESEVTDLLELLAARDAVPGDVPALAAAVLARTNGNPFFVHEVSRHLIELGRAGADELALPEGVRDVVGRRLSRLTQTTNHALRVASAIGTEFELGVLEGTGAAGGDLLRLLDEAVAARIVVELPDAPGLFRFTHSLIRQTLYEELTTTRRVQLHAVIGQALETLFAEDLTAHVPRLALHFTEAAAAGRSAKAAHYSWLAARQATDRLAYDEAVLLAERGLSALDADPTPSPEVRARLLLLVAEAETGLLEFDRARHAAAAAAAAAREAGSPECLVGAVQAVAGAQPRGLPAGRNTELVDLCHEALAAVGDGSTELRARALTALATHLALVELGSGAVADAESAVRMARESRDPDTLCRALAAYTWALVYSPRTAEQLEAADELIRLAAASAYPVHEANGHFYRALGCLLEFDGPGYRQGAAELSRLARLTCSPWVSSNAALARSAVAFVGGRFADVESCVEEMMATAGTDLSLAACGATLLSLVRYEQGHHAESAHILHDFCDRHDLPAEARVLLTFPAARTDLDEAARLLDGARLLGLDQLVDLGKYWLPLGAQLAECAVRTDDQEAAALILERLRPSAGLLAAGGAAAGFGAVDRFLGMLAARCGRFQEAFSMFETALELEEALGAPGFAAWTGYWYARALLECGGSANQGRARRLIDRSGQVAVTLGMGTLSTSLVSLGADHSSR